MDLKALIKAIISIPDIIKKIRTNSKNELICVFYARLFQFVIFIDNEIFRRQSRKKKKRKRKKKNETSRAQKLTFNLYSMCVTGIDRSSSFFFVNKHIECVKEKKIVL